MTTHYVLVAIDTPGMDDPDLAAEMIQSVLEEDGLLYIVGQSGGPNPPYERHGQILSVTAEQLE